MALEPRARLGVYEVVAKLGEGGMGEVYRARDTELDRDVALKILPQAFAADPDRLARFEREAKTLAALNHPNIAHLHGIERAGDTRALVMELVPGEDLSQILARGALPLTEAREIARQITLALEAAHANGIIHRDLKPANIKVRDDGTVKALDFGLAKAASDAGTTTAGNATMTSPAVTQAGIILGTAAYMAPEQARGRPVDKRADIWAFGCVLYEMVTGARPFGGASTGSGQADNVTDVIAAVVTKDPDWTRLPAGTPNALRRLLVRCLQKDPRQRLHDIADARLELDALSADEPGDSHAGVTPAARGRWPTPILISAALAALAAGAALGFAWRASTATAPAPHVEWKSERLGGPTIAFRPRLSPDGHLLAFLSVNDGLSQVSVMKPGTGVWTQLTRDRAHGLTFTMSWSADGSHIYYDRSTDSPNGIYSVPALGGEERLVIENAQNPAAVPDGSILFGRQNADRITQLHRFWPASGKLEPLPFAIDPDHFGPIRALGADRALVMGRPLDTPLARNSLWIFELASHQVRPIGGDAASLDAIALTVDPRDQSAVISVRDGSSYRVLRVTTDGQGTITPLLTLLASPDVDVAPDGTLYVGLQVRPSEVLQFAESGANPETIVVDETFHRGLAPLPDGRALAVSRIGSGPRVVVLAPGKDPVRLVETGENTQGPMTAVGSDRAALLIGPDDSADIAVVALNTGRILKRFKAPVTPTTLGASPDGTTLYVSAGGSISAIAIETGATRTLSAGDTFVVDPDTGDLIVRFDESPRYRLVRLTAAGKTTPIAMNSDLRMIFYPLTPDSIRRGKLVLPVSSVDSWSWYVAILDLATGNLRRVNVRPDLDFHAAAWTPDGRIVAYGFGTSMSLWKFSR